MADKPEDDSLTIQYLRNRVTSLEADKKNLEQQLKDYEHNQVQLKVIWQTIFPSDTETKVNVDKLHEEYTRLMTRTSELENSILCLKNRESELLLQLCESQKVIHKHQTQMMALRDELKSVSLRNRKAQFVDPVINHNFNLMLSNMNELNKRLKSSRDESLANGFNLQSQTGRSLIEKCKKLIIENQILGRQIQMNKNSNRYV